MVGWVMPELTARHFDRPSLRRGAVAPFKNKVDLIALLMPIGEGTASLINQIDDADNDERLPSRPDEAVQTLLPEFLDRAPISAGPIEQVGGNGCALLDQSPMQPAVTNIKRFVPVIPPGAVFEWQWQKEVSAKVGCQKIARALQRHAKERITNAPSPVSCLGEGNQTLMRLLTT